MRALPSSGDRPLAGALAASLRAAPAPMAPADFERRARGVFGALPTDNQPALRREYAERVARQRREDRIAIAKARGVPLDADTMDVVLAPFAEVQSTPMIDLFGALHARRSSERRLPLLKFFIGGVDTGKTCAGSRAVAWHDKPALYVLAKDLPETGKDVGMLAFGLQESTLAERARLRSVDLLVIDEVGLELYPERVIEWANERYGLGLATVLLGNALLDSTARYAETRFESRLYDRQHRMMGHPLVQLDAGELHKRARR